MSENLKYDKRKKTIVMIYDTIRFLSTKKHMYNFYKTGDIRETLLQQINPILKLKFCLTKKSCKIGLLTQPKGGCGCPTHFAAYLLIL